MSALHEGIHVRMERGGEEEPLRLTIPMHSEGGVTVLAGEPGAGKTETLAAISEAMGGQSRARRPMELEGFGIRLTIAPGKPHRPIGELLVTGIDGTDPSILVEPIVQKPEARERTRIAAICRMARASVDEARADLAALAGGEEELKRLCRADTLETQDLVELVARVKRDLEAKARDFEGERDKARNAMVGKRAALEALGDLPGEIDAAGARERYEGAVRELAATEGARDSAARLLRAKAEAAQALAQLEDRGTEAELARARTALAEGQAERARLAEALAHARRMLELHEQALVQMDRTVKAHEVAAKQRESLDRVIAEAVGAEPVSDEWLAELRQVRDQARQESEAAAQAERINERAGLMRLELEALRNCANENAERADVLRRAAAGTEGVLTAACSRVCGDSIKVENGRLMAVHRVRGWIPFDELSTGEAYAYAIPIAAKAVHEQAEREGKPAMLVLRQEAWQALNEDGHDEIRRLARENGVQIIAAKVARGSLRAEVA